MYWAFIIALNAWIKITTQKNLFCILYEKQTEFALYFLITKILPKLIPGSTGSPNLVRSGTLFWSTVSLHFKIPDKYPSLFPTFAFICWLWIISLTLSPLPPKYPYSCLQLSPHSWSPSVLFIMLTYAASCPICCRDPEISSPPLSWRIFQTLNHAWRSEERGGFWSR